MTPSSEEIAPKKWRWSEPFAPGDFPDVAGLRMCVHHVPLRPGWRRRLGLWLMGRETRCRIVEIKPAKEGLNLTVNVPESAF